MSAMIISALVPFCHPLSSYKTSSRLFHFGAGCFWKPADDVKHIPGIFTTTVGYSGDDSVFGSPSYETVCSGRTNLVETVRVEYDPSVLSYKELLEIFSRVNTAVRGSSRQYEGVIFVRSEEEAAIANEFLNSNTQVIAKVEPMSTKFFKAEKYHQNYWEKLRIRIPMFVGSILVANQFGGDRSQTISNVLCYGFIGILLLERGIDSKVHTLTTETGEIH